MLLYDGKDNVIIGFRVGPSYPSSQTYKLIKFADSSTSYFADWNLASISTNSYLHGINFGESQDFLFTTSSTGTTRIIARVDAKQGKV